MHALIGLFNRDVPLKVRMYRVAAIAVPCVLIIIFFLVQKHIRGWYVFPLYSSIIEHHWGAFWYKFRMACLRDTFYANYKFYYLLLLLVLALLAAAKSKNIRYLALLLPAVLIYYFVDDLRAGRIMPSFPFFMVFLASVAYFLYVFSSKKMFEHSQQRRFVVLAATFVVCFITYSTMNYYTYRYIMAAIIPLLFLVAVFADVFIARSFSVLFYPALAIVLLIAFCSFNSNKNGHGDTELGAFTAMEVQQKEVDFMVSHYQDRNITVGSGPFLTLGHLIDSTTGFLHGAKPFKDVHWEHDKAAVVLFNNIEHDDRYDAVKKNPAFYRVYRYEKDSTWTEIYARK